MYKGNLLLQTEYFTYFSEIKHIFCPFTGIRVKNLGIVMKTSTVCRYLTETSTGQTRELSSDQKSRLQSGIGIEVGKAVISTSFKK